MHSKLFCGNSCGGSTEKDQDWFEICTGTIESPFVLQMESTLEAKWDGDNSSVDDSRCIDVWTKKNSKDLEVKWV